MLTTPDDEQHWVEQARHDPTAFGYLYDHYFPKVYAYVNYRVGHVQDTEDLVSEIFLKAVDAMASFEWRHTHSFAAWLFRIAHNVLSKYHRHHRRWGDALPLDALPDSEHTALLLDDIVLQRERFAQMRTLLGKLTPRQREVITLKFFGGLHNYEIATVLAIDERTVATHLCRGLEDLQRRYAADSARMAQAKETFNEQPT